METIGKDIDGTPVGGFFMRRWQSSGRWYHALYERTEQNKFCCRINARGVGHGSWSRLNDRWGDADEARSERLADETIAAVRMLAIHRRYQQVRELLGADWPNELVTNTWLHNKPTP